MEDALDTNAANSPDRTADMTNQEIVIKKTEYAGNEAAQRTMERSLSQASGADMEARGYASSNMAIAHDIAREARFTNGSNRGVGEY
jgi:hypothetical protein